MFQDKKSQGSVSSSQTIGVIQIVFGSIFTFIFGLTFLVALGELIGQEDDMTTGLFFFFMVIFGLSLYLFICGIRRVLLISLCKYYLRLLSQAPSHSINQLAVTLKSPVHIVRKKLYKMIRKGFIASAYIDHNTDRIICTSYNQNIRPVPVMNPMPMPSPMPISNPNYTARQMPPVEHVTVSCKNCGASNRIIKGAYVDCEYCGTNIH